MLQEGGFVCEPFIVVKRAGIDGHQLWSTSQLENKLIDMREMYSEKMIGAERYLSAKYFSAKNNFRGMTVVLEKCSYGRKVHSSDRLS